MTTAHRQPSSGKPKPPASQPTSSSNANARQAAETHATAAPARWSKTAWRRYLYAAAHAPSLMDLESLYGLACRPTRGSDRTT